MANTHCSFRGGKIYVAKGRLVPRRRPQLLGNAWRGTALMTAAVLLYKRWWELGLMALALALLWSLIAGVLIKWRRIVAEQRVLRLLRQDKVDLALEICGEPEPQSPIWWQRLYSFFSVGQWPTAVQHLEAVEGGKERDYLLAVAYLGQGMPEKALALCPQRPHGQWQLLKAQAYFQLQEWKKVLGSLRGLGLPEDQEYNWLKGGSYYFLGQYKPAVKLLRQVSEQRQEEYACADLWLQNALTRLE